MKISHFAIIFGLFFPCLIFGEYLDEKEAINRVTAHLIIHDASSASNEAKAAVEQFPESEKLKRLLLRSLAEEGEEKQALGLLKDFAFAEEENAYKYDLLESLAWGVLNKGETSSQINIRLISVLGSFFTHDAKAVPTLLRQLRSSNAHERALAVRLSSSYRDQVLKDEIHKLLIKEKVWYVRLELIQTIGQMSIEELSEDLKDIIANPKSTYEEKSLAIKSLLTMYDRIDDEELYQLILSNRAGLRMLACEIALHLGLKNSIPKFLPLLDDPSPDVRVSALNVLGIIGINHLQNNEEALSKVLQSLDSPISEVSITAAWAIMSLNTEKALKVLGSALVSQDAQIRRMASGALARSGKHGEALSLKMLKESDDSFVKANIALGLIGRRVNVHVACDVLYDFLEEKNKIMWEGVLNPLFQTVGPSMVRHIPQIPSYPHVVDQLTRLNLLNLLAILRYDKALSALKTFLSNPHWGVIGSAAITLLEEGDSETLDLIKELLTDSNENVRLQSAMAIALLGGDPKATAVLQQTYPLVERDKKMHILEAIGHIGEGESIPFLLEIFDEPFQTLRIIAASALIQCIYH